jgi:hypothetical protein
VAVHAPTLCTYPLLVTLPRAVHTNRATPASNK